MSRVLGHWGAQPAGIRGPKTQVQGGHRRGNLMGEAGGQMCRGRSFVGPAPALHL